MHFLFIYESLGLGGTETLIARMAKWLIQHDHQVTLLVKSSGVEKRLMPPGLKIIELGERYEKLYFYIGAKKIWKRLGLNVPVLIKAFDPKSAWIGTILSTVLSPNPTLLVGAYGPYFIPDCKRPFRNWYGRLMTRNIERNVDCRSRVFMNAELLNEFRATYGSDQKGLIWHLPVDGKQFSNAKRNPKWGAIVSVGRLELMKEYNLYMIDVIKRLAQKGHDVTWTVYGDGPFEARMRKQIDAESLQGRIFLKGKVEYSKLSEAFSEAYIFVGMGTAIIEAAFCRVPGVVALAHDTTGMTYGPLYNFPPGNCGDLMDSPPARSVENEIERILKMSPVEYEIEMSRVQSYAGCYGIDHQMTAFLKIAEQAKAAKKDLLLFLGYYFYSFYSCLRWPERHFKFARQKP